MKAVPTQIQAAPSTWGDILRRLVILSPGIHLRAPTVWLPHPSQIEGFRRSQGMGEGEHWRYALQDGRGLHVVAKTHEGREVFEIHLDAHDPAKAPISHLSIDASPAGFALGLVIGGASGAALSPEDRGKGATLGALLGVALQTGLSWWERRHKAKVVDIEHETQPDTQLARRATP